MLCLNHMDQVLNLIGDLGKPLGQVRGPLPHCGDTYDIAGEHYTVVGIIHQLPRLQYHSLPSVKVLIILSRLVPLPSTLNLIHAEIPVTP